MRGLGRSRELDRPARTAVSAVVVSVVALAGCGGDRVGAGASPSSATNSTGDGLVRFHDSETGVAGRYPDGWHRARALTNQVLPREVLTLATYPLRGGAKAGECAPDTARADMPPGGVFVWLLEYRPARGDVWVDLPRDRFPPRPSRFRIPRERLAPVSCFDGPGYSTTFRAADRPFQLLVAFGREPSDDRLNEVESILDRLEFDPLPAPPSDPYAGWPLINDNPGDSLRPRIRSSCAPPLR